MCLGAKARAANERMKRDWEHKIQKRERNWMQTLSLTNVEHIQHKQLIDDSNLGLANIYTDIQEKHGKAVDAMFEQSQEDWKAFLSKNTGDQFKAAGRLGRSTDRIGAIELGQYLKKGNDMVTKLADTQQEWSKQGAQAAAKTRAQQMQSFANIAFIKNPDMIPPKPVFQDVGAAAFQDALQIGTQIATIGTSLAQPWSDRRLKENIKKIGESISGLGIYKFNYIGKAKQYIGAMADEVLKITPKAAILGDDGFYRINYDLLDIDFKEVV